MPPSASPARSVLAKGQPAEAHIQPGSTVRVKFDPDSHTVALAD